MEVLQQMLSANVAPKPFKKLTLIIQTDRQTGELQTDSEPESQGRQRPF